MLTEYLTSKRRIPISFSCHHRRRLAQGGLRPEGKAEMADSPHSLGEAIPVLFGQRFKTSVSLSRFGKFDISVPFATPNTTFAPPQTQK